MIVRTLAAGAALLALSGCLNDAIEPRMFQPAYPPAAEVDIYYSPDAVPRDGTVIGEITLDTSAGWTVDMAHKRLLDTARARGANAVVIGGLSRDQAEGAMGISGVKRQIDVDAVSARLIRYTQ